MRKQSHLGTATEDSETIAYEATRQDSETPRQDGKKHDGTVQQDEAVRQWDLDSQRSYSVPHRVAVSSGSRADVPEQGNGQRQQDKTRFARWRTRWRGGTVDGVSTNTMVGSEDEKHTEAS